MNFVHIAVVYGNGLLILFNQARNRSQGTNSQLTRTLDFWFEHLCIILNVQRRSELPTTIRQLTDGNNIGNAPKGEKRQSLVLDVLEQLYFLTNPGIECVRRRVDSVFG